MHVSAINIYPIKSCRGFSVPEAEVEARGLAGDRRYMLVDANGKFLTQREHTRMALIDVHATRDGYRVEAPGQPPLEIPHALASGVESEVRIWRDTVPATLAGEDINIWFSQYLGFACGLVYQALDQHRPVTNDAAEFDDEVSFADGAPILLISTGSLADLNGRLAAPVTMDRFRPNIVVEAPPFIEDSWRSIAIGSAELAVAWQCGRCILPTIDPATGVKHPRGEPLETLRSYRRVGPKIMFGQNVIPRKRGTIRVGDSVRVQ
ncbi:MAG TPA: MOSC N-terminal beta barrel domain-containing protein [Gammaproteobacteria bacterium]|jgi:uncharacterized protein YcbX